jgi:hypothetical protein
MPWQEVTDPDEIAAAEAMLGGKPTAPAPGKLSVQDNKFLNELRATSGQGGLEAETEYRNAARVIDRLGTGPVRAAMLDAFIPEDGGGFFDKVGGLLGAPFIDRQTVDDFQTLKGLQSKRVLSSQLEQKGPQTESDAARLKLTEVSPYNTPEANRRILDAGMRKARLSSIKPDFFTKWVNQYGLNGLDPQGRSVDAAWADVSRRATTAPAQTRQPPARADGVVTIRNNADFAKLPSGTRFVGPDKVVRIKP